MLLGEEDLGAPVPERDDLMRIGLDRHAEGTGKTEISKLNHVSISADKQVLGFKIPVEDPI